MINIFYNLSTKISKTKTILKSEKYPRMNSYRGTEGDSVFRPSLPPDALIGWREGHDNRGPFHQTHNSNVGLLG